MCDSEDARSEERLQARTVGWRRTPDVAGSGTR